MIASEGNSSGSNSPVMEGTGKSNDERHPKRLNLSRKYFRLPWWVGGGLSKVQIKFSLEESWVHIMRNDDILFN